MQPNDPFMEPPRLPRGFVAAGRGVGLKAQGNDLALFLSRRPAAAAALFTRNHFPGAPIILGRQRMRRGRLQGVVVNSAYSNVATGEAGLEDAREMARLAAREFAGFLGQESEQGQEAEALEDQVLVGSTGVIGRPLPMDRIRNGMRGMGSELDSDPWPAARAIITTDTRPKVFSLQVGDAVVTGVGKGAGMIAPNMATMLVYLFTDAQVEVPELQAALQEASRQSFELLSVDTDTSTSDMVVALANGEAGEVDHRAFVDALTSLCTRLAEEMARDGEGATKLVRVLVEGAVDPSEARTVARSVVESPLMKTMAYGADPNVGRILMAVGKCVGCRIRPERVDASIQGVEVIRGGRSVDFDEARVRELLGGDPVEIRIDLGVGTARGRALGCDLTAGYIEENAAYASS